VIKVSCSQPGWFHGLNMEWNTTDHDDQMGYMIPFIPPSVTATCLILNHTLINCILHFASTIVYHHQCTQNMSTNRSPPKTPNVALLSCQFEIQQRREDNSGSSERSSRTTTGQDSQFGKHTNQYHPLHGYGYLPSHQAFPAALQFYQHSPFNMMDSPQPATSASQGFPSYGPQWQGYDLHQGG